MLHTVCPRSPTEFSPALLSVARLLGSNVARRDQIGTISGETGAIRDPSLEERACVKPDSQTRPEDCLLTASQLPSPAAAPAVLTPPAPLIPPNAEPASAVQTAYPTDSKERQKEAEKAAAALGQESGSLRK